MTTLVPQLPCIMVKNLMDKAYFHALQILLNDEPKKTIIWLILLFDDIVVCPLSHQTRLNSMDHDDVLAPRTCGCFSLCVTQRRSSYLVGSHRKKQQNVWNYIIPCRSWGTSWGTRPFFSRMPVWEYVGE